MKYLKTYKLFENNNINYRLGNEGDLKQIKKITNQLRDTLPFVMNVALIDAIKNNGLIVAELDGEVVGFVHYHKRKDGWNTLHEIGVERDHKGLGIGKELFNMIPKPIRLKCTVDNDYANEFYKRQGMKLVKIEQGKKRKLNVWELE